MTHQLAGVSIPSHARRPPITDSSPLPTPMPHRHTGIMTPDNQAFDRRFRELGRIIAVLELGARVHGEIRWTHLYYALGYLPHAGLPEPLQKHGQSVLPALQRRGTADRYTETLNLLATELQEKAMGNREQCGNRARLLKWPRPRAM